jgi:prevent-host-death family protein
MCYKMRKLTQRELRNNSGEVMRALEDGEDFVVTRNGTPIGELRPLRRPQFVSRDALRELFAGAPRIDYEQFRADIDRYVDQDPTPRG